MYVEARIATGAGVTGRCAGVAPARNSRRISVAPPRLRRRPPSTSAAGAARALKSPHYPLTIRNRPTSWLLDLGYNDLTSAK